MARIRTIKPEFPQSESMGRVSREARLCFILLWTMADDAGRLRAASRMLASLLYPYDDDAAEHMDGWLGELEAESCIVRYQVDGTAYIQICKWLEHQKIDRPSPSRIPSFDEQSRVLASPREASPPDLGPRTMEGNIPATQGDDLSPSIEKQVFDLGRKVLGKSAGGQVTKLRKVVGDDAATLDLLQQASAKSNPAEWISGVIRQRAEPETDELGLPVENYDWRNDPLYEGVI